MDLKLDIELLTTQPILQIRQPTAKDISDLHWNELTFPADWDTYFPFYNEKQHTAKLLHDYWGGQIMPFSNSQ